MEYVSTNTCAKPLSKAIIVLKFNSHWVVLLAISKFRLQTTRHVNCHVSYRAGVLLHRLCKTNNQFFNFIETSPPHFFFVFADRAPLDLVHAWWKAMDEVYDETSMPRRCHWNSHASTKNTAGSLTPGSGGKWSQTTWRLALPPQKRIGQSTCWVWLSKMRHALGSVE